MDINWENKSIVLFISYNLWIRLSKTGGSRKRKILKRMNVFQQMKFSSCPLCESSSRIELKGKMKKCESCRSIFTWNTTKNHCSDPDSFYSLWVNSKNIEERKFYARKMADWIKIQLDNSPPTREEIEKTLNFKDYWSDI